MTGFKRYCVEGNGFRLTLNLQGDSKLSQELSIGDVSQYNISVATSNIAYAGTDSRVYMDLLGTNGTTKQFSLVVSKTHSNPFEQNQTDVFEIEQETIGRLTGLVVGHDGSGRSSSWHVDKVKQSHLLSSLNAPAD